MTWSTAAVKRTLKFIGVSDWVRIFWDLGVGALQGRDVDVDVGAGTGVSAGMAKGRSPTWGLERAQLRSRTSCSSSLRVAVDGRRLAGHRGRSIVRRRRLAGI